MRYQKAEGKANIASAITYSELSSGSWTIIIEAPDYGFLVQRQFNLTIGARNDRTVIVTVSPPPVYDLNSPKLTRPGHADGLRRRHEHSSR